MSDNKNINNEITEEIIDLEDEMVQHRDGDKFFHKKIYSDEEVYIYKVNNNWFEVFRRNIVPQPNMKTASDPKPCPPLT